MIKNLLKAFVAGAVVFLMIGEIKILIDLDKVKTAVVETNEIVKEIQLNNTPYSLNNDYHCLASNISYSLLLISTFPNPKLLPISLRVKD